MTKPKDSLANLGESAASLGIPFADVIENLDDKFADAIASYTVTCDNLAGHESGDEITESDLADGCNIAALVEGGHLARVTQADSAETKEK